MGNPVLGMAAFGALYLVLGYLFYRIVRSHKEFMAKRRKKK